MGWNFDLIDAIDRAIERKEEKRNQLKNKTFEETLQECRDYNSKRINEIIIDMENKIKYAMENGDISITFNRGKISRQNHEAIINHFKNLNFEIEYFDKQDMPGKMSECSFKINWSHLL